MTTKNYKKGAARQLKNGNIEVITSINRKENTYKSTIVDSINNEYYNCGPNKKEKWLNDTWTESYCEEM